MQTEKKPIYKTLLFWEIVVGAAVVLGIVIAMVVALSTPLPNTQPTDATEASEATDPTGATEATEESILPTNPIGLGDFKMEGDYLSCTVTPSVLGIDVSFWQGYINWEKVKQAGVEFAIIRLGGRGWEQGELITDDYAQTNYRNATEAGIKVGAYFFSQAINVEEAVEEAQFVLDMIRGWDVQMPIVFDWEFVNGGARTAKVDARTLTDCTKAFCQTIEAAGYEAMIYFNADQSKNRVYLEELADYKFWLAMYDTVLNYPYKVDMWQYTDAGAVPGISGNVDINLYFPWEEE
ncbi:MAG: glycoside hydrolase family 25 protein [Oscillospiraceae bacterium]|nr:glycoside hydrolase family 25 protein [Oscillospiraceae bacterium]